MACQRTEQDTYADIPRCPECWEEEKPEACDDTSQCLLKLIEKLTPELLECIGNCQEVNPCRENNREALVDPPPKLSISEEVYCELRAWLLKLAHYFYPELAACFEPCVEETPCCDAQPSPDPCPTEPSCNPTEPTSCSDIRDCLVKIMQTLTPELAVCMKTCAEEIPCCDAQPNPDPCHTDLIDPCCEVEINPECHAPKVPETDCDVYTRCLLKIASTLQPELAKCLENDNVCRPDYVCDEYSQCLIKVACSLLPEMADCLNQQNPCKPEIPCAKSTRNTARSTVRLPTKPSKSVSTKLTTKSAVLSTKSPKVIVPGYTTKSSVKSPTKPAKSTKSIIKSTVLPTKSVKSVYSKSTTKLSEHPARLTKQLNQNLGCCNRHPQCGHVCRS